MNNVAIIGAGAVGCAVGKTISDVIGPDRFSFVANGERAERILRAGLMVNGEVWHPRVSSAQSHEHIDLLLVLVKNYSLEDAMKDIESVVDEDTVILSLLNGVTGVDALTDRFPNNHVLYGIVMRTDANRTDETVTFSTLGQIQFGDEWNVEWSPDVCDVAALFDECGINYHVYEDMKRMLWRKWMVNIGANQISLLTAAKFKYFPQIPEISSALDLAMQEIVDIAKAQEIHLTRKDKEDMIEVLLNYPPEKRTSMLQDLEAKRRTEIDYFAGTVVSLGKKSNVPTPVNEILYYLIKAREIVNLEE